MIHVTTVFDPDTTKLSIASVHQEYQESDNDKYENIPIKTTNLPYDITVSPGIEGVELTQGERVTFTSVNFTMTRTVDGRYDLYAGYFLPTGLFALLSFISFLIKPENVSLKLSTVTARKCCSLKETIYLIMFIWRPQLHIF